jgi:hypothetical protein
MCGWRMREYQIAPTKLFWMWRSIERRISGGFKSLWDYNDETSDLYVFQAHLTILAQEDGLQMAAEAHATAPSTTAPRLTRVAC